jgi:hypothetical protein
MKSQRSQLIAGSAAFLFVLASLSLIAMRAEDRKGFETVLVHTSCAPWDGPAVEIEFYTSPARCDQNRASILRISLWRNLPPRAGQKISLGRDSRSGVEPTARRRIIARQRNRAPCSSKVMTRGRAPLGVTNWCSRRLAAGLAAFRRPGASFA